MPTNKEIKSLRNQKIPWNDVREQRVLNNIKTELQSPGRRPATQYVFVAFASAVVLFFAVIGLTRGDWAEKDSQNHSDSQLITSSESFSEKAVSKQQNTTSTLVLKDAGRVIMTAGAQVSVITQTDWLLELDHPKGRARYEVIRRRGRDVMIHAAGVKIHVIGTVFTVSVFKDVVEVDVERGVVKIDNGRRKVELRAGETIAIRSESMGEQDTQRVSAVPNAPLDNKKVVIKMKEQLSSSSKTRPLVDTSNRDNSHDNSSDEKNIFKKVDEARRAGDYQTAAILLGEIVANNKRKSIVTSARFMLGRVESSRMNHTAAALAFKSCYKNSPGGSLNEDARAEEAASWAQASQRERAKAAANNYLARYPEGIHAKRMRRLSK